jgi:hypothetical protein
MTAHVSCHTKAQQSIDTELEKGRWHRPRECRARRTAITMAALGTTEVTVIELASATIETHSPQSWPAKGQRRP